MPVQPAPLEREVRVFYEVYRRLFGKSPSIVIECGARDSQETELFSRYNTEGQIYSFECNPFTLPRCRERVARLQNAELIEKAVSDKDGTVTFYPTDPVKTQTEIADGNPGASSLFQANPDYPLEKYAQTAITVPTTRLESFLHERGISAVDAVWMDIQGAELMALRGLGGKLDQVGMVFLETEFFPLYQGQPLFGELKQFLNSQGFKLYSIVNLGTFAGDVIFINQRKVGALLRLQLGLSDALLYPYRKFRRAVRELLRKLFKV